MKAITANRLDDGSVVYLGDDDQWTTQIKDAARFGDDDAPSVLAAVQTRICEITDAYAIDINSEGLPAARTALREAIRSAGPTIRTDLCQQEGCTP